MTRLAGELPGLFAGMASPLLASSGLIIRSFLTIWRRGLFRDQFGCVLVRVSRGAQRLSSRCPDQQTLADLCNAAKQPTCAHRCFFTGYMPLFVSLYPIRHDPDNGVPADAMAQRKTAMPVRFPPACPCRGATHAAPAVPPARGCDLSSGLTSRRHAPRGSCFQWILWLQNPDVRSARPETGCRDVWPVLRSVQASAARRLTGRGQVCWRGGPDLRGPARLRSCCQPAGGTGISGADALNAAT